MRNWSYNEPFLLFQADAQLDFERRQFYQESMKYVLSLQEVQERKKFEFVETVSLLQNLHLNLESCWQLNFI